MKRNIKFSVLLLKLLTFVAMLPLCRGEREFAESSGALTSPRPRPCLVCGCKLNAKTLKVYDVSI